MFGRSKWIKRIKGCLSIIIVPIIILANVIVLSVYADGTESTMEVPVVINNTWKAFPGQAIGLYGEFYNPQDSQGNQNVTVAILPLTGYSGELKPENAQKKISAVNIQNNAIQGILPEDITTDLYAVWVQNKAGWSEPVFINRVEPFWVADHLGYAGKRIRLVGRNFKNPYTNTAQGAAVQLVGSDGSQINAKVVEVTDYTLDFEVPESVAADTEYAIKVTNGAGGQYGWVDLNPKTPQKLKILQKNQNITELTKLTGVTEAWLSFIPYDKKYNVKEFGAAGDGVKDDTDAFKAAMDKAALNGGGIVFVPNGKYMINEIIIPANTILMGESRDGAVLSYLGGRLPNDTESNYGPSTTVIHSDGNYVGIAQLTFSNDIKRPDTDQKRRLEGWVSPIKLGYLDKPARTAAGYFVKNVNINNADGCGLEIQGISDIVVDDCSIIQTHTAITYNLVSGYAKIRNNKWFCPQRPSIYTLNRVGFNWIEGNQVDGKNIGMGREPGLDKAGQYTKAAETEHRVMDLAGVYNYIANNKVTGQFGAIGDPSTDNAGEGICFQGQKRLAYSKVSEADDISLTDNDANFESDNQDFKDGFLTIIEGKGMGQIYKIKTNTDKKVVIDGKWKIKPDSTSVYTIDVQVCYRTILEGNEITAKTKKAGIVLYTKDYEVIAADNDLRNTGGIWTTQTQNYAQKRADYSYFTYVGNNKISGGSNPDGANTKGNSVVIGPGVDGGIVTQSTPELPTTGIYGNMIRNNEITGIGTNIEPINKGNESFVNYSGITVSTPEASGRPLAVGLIIESNKVTNTSGGVHLANTSYDTLLHANTFTGNAKDYDDEGSVRTNKIDDSFDINKIVFNKEDPALTTVSASFEDVQSHWAKDAIEYAVSKGIVKGVDGTHFAPDLNITRAEYLALVVRVLKLNSVKYQNSYQDVAAGEWYADIAQAAQEAGLIDAGMVSEDNFRPNDPINREEMTSIIIAAYNHATGKNAVAGSIDGFTDKDQISPWALKYVEAANEMGFIKGVSDTEFAPKNSATRAQAVVIIKRLMDNL